jgi:uncharacterized membrane protein
MSVDEALKYVVSMGVVVPEDVVQALASPAAAEAVQAASKLDNSK